FLGEVPVGFVADELDRLDAELRSVALAALGMVQIAGSASLGEGRLGSFRMDIFRSCVEGVALDNRSKTTRLARLLAPAQHFAEPPSDDARASVAALGPDHRNRLDGFLESTPLHGWHRVVADVDRHDRLPILLDIVECWSASPADHVVLESDGWSDP